MGVCFRGPHLVDSTIVLIQQIQSVCLCAGASGHRRVSEGFCECLKYLRACTVLHGEIFNGVEFMHSYVQLKVPWHSRCPSTRIRTASFFFKSTVM